MNAFNKLLAYTEARLATNGLCLSEYGKAKLLERFNKDEADGGFSPYWHNL